MGIAELYLRKAQQLWRGLPVLLILNVLIVIVSKIFPLSALTVLLRREGEHTAYKSWVFCWW